MLSSSACSLDNLLFSLTFFYFSFRLHLICSCSLSSPVLLSLQANSPYGNDFLAEISASLYTGILSRFSTKKTSLALLLLKPFPAPGASDSITKPAVWKQASIRAHQMIKEGWNSFKFPLYHLVLETNYSHTITNWALKSTNTYEFSLMLSLPFLFL